MVSPGVAMKQVLVIHLNHSDYDENVIFLGQDVQLLHRGSGGDSDQVRALLAKYDGEVDAIGLDGMNAQLQLGGAQRPHHLADEILASEMSTPVVDGSGVRAGLERWGVILADRAEPGIFAQKRVLMVPGLNHVGLAQALDRRGSAIHYADPVVYFGLPAVPGVGGKDDPDASLNPYSRATAGCPFPSHSSPSRRTRSTALSSTLFMGGCYRW